MAALARGSELGARRASLRPCGRVKEQVTQARALSDGPETTVVSPPRLSRLSLRANASLGSSAICAAARRSIGDTAPDPCDLRCCAEIGKATSASELGGAKSARTSSRVTSGQLQIVPSELGPGLARRVFRRRNVCSRRVVAGHSLCNDGKSSHAPLPAAM